jgi:hypothetical protein
MGQGYHFGKPADSIATLRYLHENYDSAGAERVSA